jgi:CheY-like chemotaxis protein
MARSMPCRVLIIEDSHDTAETTRLLLKLSGHEAQTASSGREGLAAARQFRPRVVLCDIAMPRMSGYEVARALRQEPSLGPLYLIAVTGYGRAEDQQQALEAGFDLHLTKPVDIDVLRRVLESIAAG